VVGLKAIWRLSHGETERVEKCGQNIR